MDSVCQKFQAILRNSQNHYQFGNKIANMEVVFRNERLRKLINDFSALQRKYGEQVAKKVAIRLHHLESVRTLEDMKSLPGRCHELKHDRKGQLALDLSKNYRLVFQPREASSTEGGGSLDWSQVESVVVLEIIDYH